MVIKRPGERNGKVNILLECRRKVEAIKEQLDEIDDYDQYPIYVFYEGKLEALGWVIEKLEGMKDRTVVRRIGKKLRMVTKRIKGFSLPDFTPFVAFCVWGISISIFLWIMIIMALLDLI